jgi:hypothetical protein
MFFQMLTFHQDDLKVFLDIAKHRIRFLPSDDRMNKQAYLINQAFIQQQRHIKSSVSLYQCRFPVYKNIYTDQP